MKRAFTLIELLIVIGIIAVLAGSLLIAGRGSTERGRAAKCATNMRNLAAASISYSVSNGGYFPCAQSGYEVKADTSFGGGGLGYTVVPGWIRFLDEGETYPMKSKGSAQECSFACPDKDQIDYARTHGAIWTAIGGNGSSYVCPAFLDACRAAGTRDPGWSYQMSAYFGYSPDKLAYKINMHELQRADRMLLFAEIPCLVPKADEKNAPDLPPVNLTGGNGTAECDGCLLYKSMGGSESIGFNHRGNRRIFGHVAFADGHVEQITAPKDGKFIELTDWLCRGYDVVFQNGSYEEIKDSVVE